MIGQVLSLQLIIIIINHACIAHITFREKSICALRMKNTEGSKVKMGQVSKQWQLRLSWPVRNTGDYEPYHCKNKYVFNILLNELIVSASLILSGRLFHNSADATANVRAP